MYQDARFLVFDTVDGLSVAVGYASVQMVRFPVNPVQFASDQKHNEGDIQVWLQGRETPVCISIGEDKDALTALFIELDTGTAAGRFPGLTDVDGELARFNIHDVAMVTAPSYEVKEGLDMLTSDNPFPDGDDSDEIRF